MPVPTGRDLEEARRALEEWLADRMPEADGLTVSELEVPGATGFSNETLVFDVEFREEGHERVRALVARVQPAEPTIFPDLDVLRQAEVMQRVAAHSDAPVPEVLWTEERDDVLGTPFFVMEKAEGRVPQDVPSYNEQGFVAEMTPGERRRLWDSAVDKLARVHRVDPGVAGLSEVLGGDRAGGLSGFLASLDGYREWALLGRPHPVAERGWAWVLANVPDDPGPAGLCWGDARVSNMVFAGTECAAILDWEMAVLGPPEQDVGWWLYFDRFSAEGYRVPRLEGLPGRAGTIDHYEGLLGRALRDLEFYEVLTGVYFALIMVRVGASLEAMGALPPGSDFYVENPAVELLARVLDEVGAR